MDLIDRQDAIDAVAFGITYVKVFDQETGEIFEPFKQENEALNKAVDRIKKLSPADAVEVVRCKNCVNFSEPNSFSGKCTLRGDYIFTNDFCSYAVKRRTDD